MYPLLDATGKILLWMERRGSSPSQLQVRSIHNVPCPYSIQNSACIMFPIECDLQIFESIQQEGHRRKMKNRYANIYCLACNADWYRGDSSCDRPLQHRSHMQIIKPFVLPPLVEELMPLLETGAQYRGDARIVTNSSLRNHQHITHQTRKWKKQSLSNHNSRPTEP